MRSTAHLNGHPIHPMLVGFPAAYLLGSAWIDAWASATGRRDWHRTANHMSALGIGSACVAAVPGLIDYLSAVPPRSSAKADRKSTRLNSSHSQISYAVFCLKNK